ncbi:MAG: hypothetical protein JNL74_14930 [Fibrobacteres bacterium]|nr:hypothetical protein [Fibrobacterota bacterium]
MKFKSIVLSALMVTIAAFTTNCSKAPEQEISNAKAAIEAAKAVEADRYSADQFKAAEDSLNAAMVEIETQKSGFALGRSYDKAKTMLAAVVTMATSAKESAVAAKEQVKAECEAAVAAANTSVTETKDLLAQAPKGKEGKEALEAISADIATVEASLAEAATAISSGDYMGARDKAVAGTEKLTSIKAELTTAIEKSKGKKGKK